MTQDVNFGTGGNGMVAGVGPLWHTVEGEAAVVPAVHTGEGFHENMPNLTSTTGDQRSYAPGI